MKKFNYTKKILSKKIGISFSFIQFINVFNLYLIHKFIEVEIYRSCTSFAGDAEEMDFLHKMLLPPLKRREKQNAD